MLYKRRIVQEDVPAETTIVTPVAQPVIERNTTVERDSMSGGTAIAVIFGGLVLIALVFYFAWYQPQNTVVTQPTPSTTVIDHDSGAAAQPIVTNPAPTIINPPAQNPTPNTTVVNPPANNTTVVNPPAGSSSTTTDNGDGTSTTTTNPTTPTAPPDNNGG